MAAAVNARNGMVASAHELSSSCGVNILSKGGNVVDAAIATSAALCVVQNNSCGLGGDTFAILKLGGKIMEINGSGRAAKAATIDFYEGKGRSSIPQRGPLSCITVPGLVHAWGELLKYATMDLSELIAPAIAYAEDGVSLNAKYVESIKASADSLGSCEGWRELFLPDGKVPEVGSVLKQKDLANSLRMIANEGTQTFYKGELAEKIVRGVKEEGGLIYSEDLENHTSNWKKPLSTIYRGVKIYETSPNSQAATVLLWLNMLENYDLGRVSNKQDSLQEILVATSLKAYEERAKYIGDPSFFPLPPEFISKKFAEQVSGVPPTARSGMQSETIGDTTYFAVGDREGNTVSMIQSNYNGFGSGVMPKGTGLVLHNRGSYFSLDRSHHNSLAPGKRTFHTLCASIGEQDDVTLFALGTMGGDIQPQVHVQLLTKILDFNAELQEAIDAPRWIIPGTIYERPSTIFYEKGLKPSRSVPKQLKVMQFEGLSSLAGHAQAVYFSNEGLSGAADPRCGGAAKGF